MLKRIYMADLYILSKAQVQDHSRITKYLKSTVQAERLAWKIFGVRKSSKSNVSLVSSNYYLNWPQINVHMCSQMKLNRFSFQQIMLLNKSCCSKDGKGKSDCLPRTDVQQPAQQDQVRAYPGKWKWYYDHTEKVKVIIYANWFQLHLPAVVVAGHWQGYKLLFLNWFDRLETKPEALGWSTKASHKLHKKTHFLKRQVPCTWIW